MSVVSLYPGKPADDVAATLRRIADEVEGGEFSWPVTTACLILGYTDAEIRMGGDLLAEQSYWTTYAMGPRTDNFTVRGLVSSAMRQWNYDD